MCYARPHHDACMNAANVMSSGMYQPHRVGMMLKCSTDVLLVRAAFMDHDDKEHNTLDIMPSSKVVRNVGLEEG